MGRIQLPKDALQKVKIGQAFAEYDLVRNDPQLFVTTPATIASLDMDGSNCFFIGRRGTGKTAITYEVQRRIKRTISIVPQIFDLLKLPLEHEEFIDTRQRPFKSLMHSMERALIDEVIKNWAELGLFKYNRAPDYIKRERGLIDDCDFDQRILNLTDEIFDAYTRDNKKLWLRQINRSKKLIEEANDIAQDNRYKFIVLIDRLDESWDGSDSAIICLMALMHASVRLTAVTNFVRPYIFIRENIYDRIRSLDNEFSRLETSVVFLDWTEEKLAELIERRLVKPFNTRPRLGGEAWSHFFEEINGESSVTSVMELCQNRPRDVLMLSSYAVDSAISHGNMKITKPDLDSASKRYSTSRLKDLGDEYAENFPNIILLLEYFYGLGNEFTLNAIADFVQKLLVNEAIKNHCKDWFYHYSTPSRLIELLYNIGFIGIKRGEVAEYKESSKDTNAKPAYDNTAFFTIHPTYREALNLRSILLKDLSKESMLKNKGMLEDLPDSFQFDEYKYALEDTLERLKIHPVGKKGAKGYEEIIGEVIKLCFFRSLTNIQPSERMINGACIRDWIASNRAADGFWEVIRNKYGATQVVWECKNYAELHADDFHQVQYYLSDTFGHFGVIVFRGSTLKASYFKHIDTVANKNKAGLILVLTENDIEVFLRQAIKGAFKEAHIQDRYDYMLSLRIFG